MDLESPLTAGDIRIQTSSVNLEHFLLHREVIEDDFWLQTCCSGRDLPGH